MAVLNPRLDTEKAQEHVDLIQIDISLTLAMPSLACTSLSALNSKKRKERKSKKKRTKRQRVRTKLGHGVRNCIGCVRARQIALLGH